MPQLTSHMEVLKILPKTNCRKCDLKTCLVFAIAVIKGEKRLEDCPHLEGQIIEKYDAKTVSQPSIEDEWRRELERLRQQISTVDFASSAERLGARLSRDGLIIKCLSKYFTVNPNGVIASDCHTNVWISIPILNYVLCCQGKEVKEEWMPMRELNGGARWGPLFGQRCEKPFKKVIDNYTGLFEDIIDIFDGRPAPDMFNSDIAIVIYPLPRFPILICYWKSEEDMESSLNMFFDVTAEDNLNIESIYTLGVGLVTMFEKIAQTHGEAGP